MICTLDLSLISHVKFGRNLTSRFSQSCAYIQTEEWTDRLIQYVSLLCAGRLNYLFAYWVIIHVFLLSADDFFQNQLFQNLFQEYHQCQTVWIQIRPDILAGLIWVQTACKGYQQMTLVGKELYNMGCNVRKPVFGVSDIARLKPACSATETS